MDASCSSCSLPNLLASHSSQLPISRVLFVQALQTSSKTNAIWLVTCIIIGRATNVGLLGQSLTKLATIYAVAIWLVICITSRAKKRFWAYLRLPGRGVCKWCQLGNDVILIAIWRYIFPCFIRSNSADVICIIGRAKKRCWAYIRLTCRPSTIKMRNTSTAPNAII